MLDYLLDIKYINTVEQMKHQLLSEIKCEERQLLVPFSIHFDEIEKFILSHFPKKTDFKVYILRI